MRAWQLVEREVNLFEAGESVLAGAEMGGKRLQVRDEVPAELEDLNISEDVKLDDWEFQQLAVGLVEDAFLLGWLSLLLHFFIILI